MGDRQQSIGAAQASARSGPFRNDLLGRIAVLLAARLVEAFAHATRLDDITTRNRCADDGHRPEDAVAARLVIARHSREDWIVAARFEDGSTLPITQPGTREMAQRLLTIIDRAGR